MGLTMNGYSRLADGHRQITVDKITLCRRANVRVEDFMTRRVVTITPDTTLLAVAALDGRTGRGACRAAPARRAKGR